VAYHLNTLHQSPLIERFLRQYPQIAPYLPSDFVRCPIEAPSIPHTDFPSPVPVPSSVPSLLSEEGKESEKGEFETFWNAYPKKAGKKAAQKAFQNARDRPRINDLLESISRQRASPQWAKEGGQFIPHPATWLNRGQWADVPTEPRPSVFQEFLARGQHHDESTGVFTGLATLDGATVGPDVSDGEHEPTEC
jgi:hypothetical protein